MPDESEPTRLLRLFCDGDSSAREKLLPLVYDELHRMAKRLMGKERADHTLQPTALINEAWMRLIGDNDQRYEGRLHFMRVAACAMRHVLVDHARARATLKRGADRHQVTFDEHLFEVAAQAETMLSIDDALAKLGEFDSRLAQVVEMRYFGGLRNEEIARALDTSTRTIDRNWRLARAWLVSAMSEAGDE